MLKPRYDQVVIFTPEGVTGGPECLHQLGHMINVLGGCAFMVYTNPFSTFKLSPTEVTLDLHPQSPGYSAYQRYEPRVSPRIELTPDTLLIFPEFYYVDLVDSALEWNLPFACWWLAVPDVHENFNKLSKSRQQDLFSIPIHFYQSHHAGRMLSSLEAKAYPLFDYTNFPLPPSSGKIPRSIAISPKKGAEFAQEFINILAGLLDVRSPKDLKIFLLQNLSQENVFESLRSVEVYVDFSCQLGKDRIPREAALAGATVFMHREGAGAYFTDSPLDPFFKFNALADLEALALRVKDVLDHAVDERLMQTQNLYRQQVLLEREEFELQVRRSFFTSF